MDHSVIRLSDCATGCLFARSSVCAFVCVSGLFSCSSVCLFLLACSHEVHVLIPMDAMLQRKTSSSSFFSKPQKDYRIVRN